MTLDQSTNESVRFVLQVLFNQFNLLSQEIFSVLQNKLRIIVNNFDNFRSLDLVIFPQKIEKTNEIAHFTGKDTPTVRTLENV